MSFLFFLTFFDPPPPPQPTNFGKSHSDPKLKNNWGPLSSTFHEGQPETLTEWKSESVTEHNGYPAEHNGYPAEHNGYPGLTGVGARDTCVSKNKDTGIR